MNLSTFILISLAFGVAFGTLLNTTFSENIELINQSFLAPVGESFLRLIQFVVVPIVFSSLIMGLTRIQGAGQVGRYTVKLMTSYLITSSIALCVGMGTAYCLQPGSGVKGFTISENISITEAPSLISWLVSLIPVNPLEALSTGNLLQIIFSAVLLGIGVQLAKEKAKPFVELIESIYHISEKTLSVILYVAPLGVFALMSSSSIMISLDMIALFILKAEPIRFLRSLSEAIALAFGTASSNAALPVVLQNIQENYGLREEIASFAIPLGTALKRDGAAILQGFNALFVAQIYQVPLTPSLLTAIAVSSLLVSFSTPGVPGSALITMATVLSASGLPLEAIALVAGIDRLTDGFKTVINIIGNSVNAIILSHWEAEQVPEAEQIPVR